MRVIEGHHEAVNLTFAVVVSRFNEFVTERLLAGALDALQKAGAPQQAIEVARVPGAFEIPLVARGLARSGRFNAVICLGAVIRGETPHFEYISAEASRGIAQAAWEADIPVIFGVLTTDNVDQALDRSGDMERNKGAEAARTGIEMANLMKALERHRSKTGRPGHARKKTRGTR
jgi:6,7-dimethyl-8-ribityllumazine synthase